MRVATERARIAKAEYPQSTRIGGPNFGSRRGFRSSSGSGNPTVPRSSHRTTPGARASPAGPAWGAAAEAAAAVAAAVAALVSRAPERGGRSRRSRCQWSRECQQRRDRRRRRRRRRRTGTRWCTRRRRPSEVELEATPASPARTAPARVRGGFMGPLQLFLLQRLHGRA